MPGTELDASWSATNPLAFQAGRVFGRDLVFMYGPLSFLTNAAYEPELYDWTVAIRALQHASMALALAVLWRPLAPRWIVALPLFALLPLSFVTDYQNLMLPCMAVLLRVSGRGTWLWPLLVILSAVFG